MAGKKGRSGRYPKTIKHGAFITTSSKNDPFPQIRRWLNVDKQAIFEDLGGLECLSGKEQIQINNVLRLLNVLYHFEIYIAHYGIFEKDGELHPLLNQYASYVNSLSRVLQSLGLKKRAIESELTLDKYIKAKVKGDKK